MFFFFFFFFFFKQKTAYEITEGDWSSDVCSSDLLLVGDAARFVDPVFSSGVSVALESAKRAADAIVKSIGRGDVSAPSFTDYEKTIRAGVAIWREFIR